MSIGSKVVAVVSHDAGGAEVLSSYVRQERLNAVFSLAGPAIQIFERKLGPITSVSLEDALDKATQVICSTGWQSDHEWKAIKMARESGIPSAAFLDHWSNYLARFTRRGMTILPDEIVVGDAIAEEIARQTFPGHLIRFIENSYIKDLKRRMDDLRLSVQPQKDVHTVLYLCEPLREYTEMYDIDAKYFGYSEEDAICYFLNNIQKLGSNNFFVIIRPHPSEDLDKYSWIRKMYSFSIRISRGRDLLEDILISDTVVGRSTMAMVVALLADKRVISCIPPGGKPCGLPQKEIIHFDSLL